MRIPGIEARYFFKAASKNIFGQWILSDGYFESFHAAQEFFKNIEFAWPVEMDAGGYFFVPDEKEWKPKEELK